MATSFTFVLGTAAELIKLYPVAKGFIDQDVPVRFVATGQSRANFLAQYNEFGLDEAKLSWLVSRTEDLDHSSGALRWFARALWAVFKAKRGSLPKERVIVHGDTLSTLVGALYGVRRGAEVIHVEAGLRSTSLFNPFPEEITRRMVSRLCRWHFAPDAHAAENLRRAGVRGHVVETGGNTLADAVELAPAQPAPSAPFVLVNVHRFENLNSAARWERISSTLLEASHSRKLIVVLHPPTRLKLEHDPDLRQRLLEAGAELRDRLPFAAFIALVKGSDFLISDGGSNQEECSYLGKPCLLLREATERREGINENCLLTRFDARLITQFLADPAAYRRPPNRPLQSPSRLITRALLAADAV